MSEYACNAPPVDTIGRASLMGAPSLRQRTHPANLHAKRTSFGSDKLLLMPAGPNGKLENVSLDDWQTHFIPLTAPPALAYPT